MCPVPATRQSIPQLGPTRAKSEAGRRPRSLRETTGGGCAARTGSTTDFLDLRFSLLHLDHTGPTTPRIERISGTPVVGQPVTLRFTASDARSGVRSGSPTALGLMPRTNPSRRRAPRRSPSHPSRAAPLYTSGRRTTQPTTPPEQHSTSSPVVLPRLSPGRPGGSTATSWMTPGPGRGIGGVEDGVGYGPDRNGHVNAALTFDGSACAVAPPSSAPTPSSRLLPGSSLTTRTATTPLSSRSAQAGTRCHFTTRTLPTAGG